MKVVQIINKNNIFLVLGHYLALSFIVFIALQYFDLEYYIYLNLNGFVSAIILFFWMLYELSQNKAIRDKKWLIILYLILFLVFFIGAIIYFYFEYKSARIER